MKLLELAFVLGDAGGMHAHVDKAFKNMTKHAKSHPDKETRDACSSAAKCLQVHMQHPSSMFEDPHSFIRLLSHLQDAPDVNRVKSATSGLGSYTPSDAD